MRKCGVGAQGSDALDGRSARDQGSGVGVFSIAVVGVSHVSEDGGGKDADDGAAGCCLWSGKGRGGGEGIR